MKKIIIDNLELNETLVSELTKWFDRPGDTAPENFVLQIDYIKDTFIRLLTDDANEALLPDIKESLAFLLTMQDSLKRLTPPELIVSAI